MVLEEGAEDGSKIYLRNNHCAERASIGCGLHLSLNTYLV